MMCEKSGSKACDHSQLLRDTMSYPRSKESSFIQHQKHEKSRVPLNETKYSRSYMKQLNATFEEQLGEFIFAEYNQQDATLHNLFM